MTRFQALFIKVLRVKWDYSWRAVHREWQIRYKNTKWNIEGFSEGHQMQGMDLCIDAMKLLGENVEDGWN